jgi:hypothetical protein
MANRVPPNPSGFRDINQWAAQFYEYSLANVAISGITNPQPVLLPHKSLNAMERAAQSGVLLYDPVQKSVVYSEDGVWRPIGMDFAAFMAEQEVLKEFGDTVSIVQKAKTLFEFGNHADLDITDGFATVWQLGKEAGLENEVYPVSGTNSIDSISSTDAADTQELAVEYHTSNGLTGYDERFTFGVQLVTLQGQTRVPLPVPCARVSQAYDNNGSTIAGDVFVYQNTPLTGGKPTDITKAVISIEGTNGETQSFKAAATISNDDYFFITKASFAVTRASPPAVAADFSLEVRKLGGVFRPLIGKYSLTSQTSVFEEHFEPYLIVPPNSDIRLVANTDTNASVVSGSFQGYLAKII